MIVINNKQYTWDRSICVFLFNRTTLPVFVTYFTGALYEHPLWFYRVIRNDCRGFNNLSHTIHLRQEYMCFFLFNRTTLPVFVTYHTAALYVHPLWLYRHQHDNRVRSKLSVACQRWWFQWRFWFVPSVPGYLREEEEHKCDPWLNPIEGNRRGCIWRTRWQLLKPRKSFRITLYFFI